MRSKKYYDPGSDPRPQNHLKRTTASPYAKERTADKRVQQSRMAAAEARRAAKSQRRTHQMRQRG